MSESNSRPVKVFRGRPLPEPGTPAGYAALIYQHDLTLPLPPRLAAIAARHRPRSDEGWLMLTPRHQPPDTLGGHLEFALKWEGVDLLVCSQLFRAGSGHAVAEVIREKPTGIYTRRLWFLYEWLTGRKLDLPDSGKVRSVLAVDPDRQFALETGPVSRRHRVRDNLPGTPAFCPMVRRTEKLARFRSERFSERAGEVIGRTHPDVLARASAFLLMDDSRASFRIEGEEPSLDRAKRWGNAIQDAGSIPLSIDEFERLQRIIIGDPRFVHLGLREGGGFIGSHDRRTRHPIPEHISARANDLQALIHGIADYDQRAVFGGMDPVVAAAALGFGLVYIHPFEDGNGRLHRWLIHHVLAEAEYNPPGLIFPISSAMLREVGAYRSVLESYSKPLLPCIQWEPTDSGNVRVLNETADYYRYFDATAHAEFLYHCVKATVQRDLPGEIAYLEAYDRFSAGVQQLVDMPDRTVDLLHRFLRQNDGHLSDRARDREFRELSDKEAVRIEGMYRELFADPKTTV